MKFNPYGVELYQTTTKTIDINTSSVSYNKDKTNNYLDDYNKGNSNYLNNVKSNNSEYLDNNSDYLDTYNKYSSNKYYKGTMSGAGSILNTIKQ